MGCEPNPYTMLCVDVPNVRDPLRGGDGFPHCVYPNSTNCPEKGCFWRRFHALPPDKFAARPLQRSIPIQEDE